MFSLMLRNAWFSLGAKRAKSANFRSAKSARMFYFFSHGYLLTFSLGAKNLVQNVIRNFIFNHEHRVVTASFITSKTNKKITSKRKKKEKIIHGALFLIYHK